MGGTGDWDEDMELPSIRTTDTGCDTAPVPGNQKVIRSESYNGPVRSEEEQLFVKRTDYKDIKTLVPYNMIGKLILNFTPLPLPSIMDWGKGYPLGEDEVPDSLLLAKIFIVTGAFIVTGYWTNTFDYSSFHPLLGNGKEIISTIFYILIYGLDLEWMNGDILDNDNIPDSPMERSPTYSDYFKSPPLSRSSSNGSNDSDKTIRSWNHIKNIDI